MMFLIVDFNLCKDLQLLSKTYGMHFESLMVGGGNSRMLYPDYLSNQLNKETTVLSPESVSQYKVSPDIISLLGCVENKEDSTVICIPSIDEILNMN